MNGKADVVQDWLQRAHPDIRLEKVALRTRGVLPEDACYHAQQCAEKALKALLLYLDSSFPKTHAIEVLLDLLKTKGLSIPSGVDEAFGLSQYGVQVRYPGEWEPVTKSEAVQALEQAAMVLVWVDGQIAC
jgi:HEPN domain-containing protein